MDAEAVLSRATREILPPPYVPSQAARVRTGPHAAGETIVSPAAATLVDLPHRLRQAIRDIPDFPKPGIVFKDLMPVLLDPALFTETLEALLAPVRSRKVDKVVGIEARGFIFAAPLAVALNAGFVPIRKPGKLPGPTRRIEYALEYGTDALEVQAHAIRPGDRVFLVDDVLATGGTAAAAAVLIAALGGVVEFAAFIAELGFLRGRERLRDLEMSALVTY